MSSILIVEDDPVFRRVLSFTVGKSGTKVETASNGELGFQRLMKGGIDFLVTDLQMPVCTGIELLTRLAAIEGYERPPAILCTAKGLELDSEELKSAFDLAAILHKPFSPRKLSELILKNLASKELSGQQSNAPIMVPAPSVNVDSQLSIPQDTR